jgi:hypothetical protein
VDDGEGGLDELVHGGRKPRRQLPRAPVGPRGSRFDCGKNQAR